MNLKTEFIGSLQLYTIIKSIFTWSDNVSGDEYPILAPCARHDNSAVSSNT